MKAIIAADLFKTQDYYKMLNEICPELDTCSPGKLKSKRLIIKLHVLTNSCL